MTELQDFHISSRSLLPVTMRRIFQGNGVNVHHHCWRQAVHTWRTPPLLSVESASMAVRGMDSGITQLPGHFLFHTRVCQRTGSQFHQIQMCW